VLWKRVNGQKFPSALQLGVVGVLALKDAREKTRDWVKLINQGLDPRDTERETREANIQERRTTLGSLMTIYVEQKVRPQRQGKPKERIIDRFILDRWSEWPITKVKRSDVIALIDEIVANGTPGMAYATLNAAKTFFGWCVTRQHLEHSPAQGLKASDLIGKMTPGTRVLSDEEIFALWKATSKLKLVWKAYFRLLLLTGARKSELSNAKWSEINLDKGTLTVPVERFKSGDAAQVIHMSKDAIELLQSVPKLERCPWVFSVTKRTPIANIHLGLWRLHKFMRAELGDEFKTFKVHDLRRTFRTRLSKLKVDYIVAELAIGHSKKGLQRVYDLHKFEDEIRDAMERMALHVRSLIDPPPSNVTQLKRA
jgi:integrase